MARALKPYPVEEIRSRNGYYKATAYLDRESKRFFLQIPGTSGDEGRIEEDSIEKLRTKAKEALSRIASFDWRPVILVTMGDSWEESKHNFGRGGEIGELGAVFKFTFHRCEKSPNPVDAKKWVERPHQADFDEALADGERGLYVRGRWIDAKAREKGEDAYPFQDISTDVEVPYDQATWDGLVALKRSVDLARGQLVELLARSDLADRLRKIAAGPTAPLLPPASRRPTRSEARQLSAHGKRAAK